VIVRTYSLLSLLVLSIPSSFVLLPAVESSTSPSSSPSSESKELRSATTRRSDILARVDEIIKFVMALWNLALSDMVWFEIVSKGRYWL
jgi:hypothetical protein